MTRPRTRLYGVIAASSHLLLLTSQQVSIIDIHSQASLSYKEESHEESFSSDPASSHALRLRPCTTNPGTALVTNNMAGVIWEIASYDGIREIDCVGKSPPSPPQPRSGDSMNQAINYIGESAGDEGRHNLRAADHGPSLCLLPVSPCLDFFNIEVVWLWSLREEFVDVNSTIEFQDTADRSTDLIMVKVRLACTFKDLRFVETARLLLASKNS
ncbi:hypothetical protein KCU65_g141, partial [Aureobasidium melanogenum]